MDVSRPVLAGIAVVVGLVLGPCCARVAARLATRDATARSTPLRDALVGALTAGLLCAAALLGGVRPLTAGLAWVAAAAVVLGAVDLTAHRLPDRVLLPAAAAFTAALLADAAVLGTWGALARGALAGGLLYLVAAAAAAVSPAALGYGDVKLLALLGLVLGWFGWGVLIAGLFLGLLLGTVVSVVLVATRRASWRSTVPLGPPLLAGAVLALAVGGVPPLP
ncbi:prepilin peptidase [Blastococcus saxobsidens]|uniref:Leader peptidase (Prepilin peptidase)/N-methyltransferase n=1 Tax=Blastococcus saxobsidens TaxID=138336 RepID=A0A4Q7Y3N1_9ACTN|nr:prepilin peptidase [Blastococcus saxobsidens]RZU31477.1 leader peptidase (prepilin peptidase)/N-methyltransferase [Blastococcus saxobsidens]